MNVKILSVLLLLFLGLTIFSSGCIGTEETKTYVVGVSPGYPPFVYYDTNGELQGIDIESIQWIAEQEGFEIEFEVIEDWDKLIPSLLAGKIDVIYSGMTITEERAKRVAFSDPYWEVFYDIAVRSNTEWTMDDFLAGRLVISVTDGSTAEDWVEEYFSAKRITPEVVIYTSASDALNAVSNGKADCCIADSSNIQYMLEQNDDLRYLGSVDSGMYYGVAMRQEQTVLHGLINTGLSNLLSSGKWGELADSYNLHT